MDYIRLLEKIKPFIAILVLVFIVLSCTQLIKYNKLQHEIKDSCGYERSDKVFCVCDKNIVSNFQITGNPYYEEGESLMLPINDSGGK